MTRRLLSAGLFSVLSVALLGSKAAPHRVSITGMQFVPATVSGGVGDEVVWTNDDLVPHSVKGEGFDSGDIAPGKSWTMTLGKPGSASYKCGYHPTMSGQIVTITSKK